jgi:hypothetical protein
VTTSLEKQEHRIETVSVTTKGDSEEIEGIISIIYHADDEAMRHAGVKKQAILTLAKALENIMNRNGQADSVNQICSLMCNRFRDDGKAWLAKDACEYLDDKYKRLGQSYGQSVPGGTDLPVECSIRAASQIQALQDVKSKFNPDHVDKKTNQRIMDLIWDIEEKQKSYCDKEGIPTFNIHSNKTAIDEINDNADSEFDEKISKPDAPISLNEAIRRVDEEAYNLTIAVADAIRDWAEKQLIRYSSQRLDQAIRWRDAMEALLKIIRQYLDDKARRTIKQWAHINANMAQHGGTAASSMSAMPVYRPGTACEQLVDPKTLEKCYRTITKEQIDARGPKYAEAIDFMVRQLILTDMMEERYIEIECGFGEWRAHSASEKLSRNA